MDFYFVYKNLAHGTDPNINLPEPKTLEERLDHIVRVKKLTNTSVTWLADTMSNDLSRALGGRPNSEFIIDQNGTIVGLRDWSKPELLRQDLERLLTASSEPARSSG